MEGTKFTFTIYFNFDDKAFEKALESHVFLKNIIQNEYVRLRNIACDELNPHYEEWNKEFDLDNYSIPEDDELKEWGGTEYCNFIRSKQEVILQEVNKKHAKGIVELCSDEICDIGGVIKTKSIAGYDHDVKFVAELIPYNK